MSKANNLTDFLTDLANTIRSITGGSALIDPQDFASIIQNLPQPLFKSLAGRSITTVTADNLAGVTQIGEGAFNNCKNLVNAELSDTITVLYTNAFRSCSNLENFIFGSSVAAIYPYSLGDCTKLKRLILPASINNIYNNAFVRCTALEYIVVLSNTPPHLDNGGFNQTNDCPIYVPTPDTYRVTTNWIAVVDGQGNSRIFPLVNTVADLQNIDTTTYTKACVIGNNEYIQYVYDGTSWVVAQ